MCSQKIKIKKLKERLGAWCLIAGGFLIGSAAGYLLETFVDFSTPGYEAYTALIVGLTAAVGELSLTGFLIFKGKLK